MCACVYIYMYIYMAIKADSTAELEELKGWRQKYDRDAESVGGAPRVEPQGQVELPS